MLPLLLTTALIASPGQTGGLKLANVRSTYGELGGPRPDATKHLPGDVLFLAFDIEGISIEDDGKVQYTMQMEVTDKDNKKEFMQEPAVKTEFIPFGGTKLPARAFYFIPTNQAAGTYTLKLTVTDRKTNATQAFTRPFEVLKADFGIVSVFTTADLRGEHTVPTAGVVGQLMFVQLGVVGFGREKSADPKASKPNVTIAMTVLDDKGQPTLKKGEQKFTMNEPLPAEEPAIMSRFVLPLTRAGKFTVRLTATDAVTKKTSTFDLPISVGPAGG